MQYLQQNNYYNIYYIVAREYNCENISGIAYSNPVVGYGYGVLMHLSTIF
jgi:hypothetical protein